MTFTMTSWRNTVTSSIMINFLCWYLITPGLVTLTLWLGFVTFRVRVTNPRVRVINPRVRVLCHTAVMMTSRCRVMTPGYASRRRLHFCSNPWPLEYRIQNGNDIIRSISSRDVEQCHEDITVSRPDARVRVTTTTSFLFKSLTPRT